MPVTKTAVTQSDESELYSAETHKRNTLFSGTRVIQTRFYGHGKVQFCCSLGVDLSRLEGTV